MVAEVISMECKDKLKELRINANLKQEDVAARLFVSRTLVSKWEAGARYPNKENLERLAGLFQVSLSELIGEARNRKRSMGERGFGYRFHLPAGAGFFTYSR
jgi:transcriptional regulator with XRE-family HTH domain